MAQSTRQAAPGFARSMRLSLTGMSLALGSWALGAAGAAAAALPPASASLVPDDGRLPLASALYTKGAEYADLSAAGYVEQEFYLSGVADAISATDGTVVAAAQPYVTRILVRRPKDARRFSGTAVVEPFSFGGERAGGWTKIRGYVLAHGDAWIGVTLLASDTPSHSPAGPQGLQQLKTYDPARYAPLTMYAGAPGQFMRATAFSKGIPQEDSFAPQGQMILAELAQLVKSGGPASPLKGFKVERFYTMTWQVQSQLWIDYLKQGRPQVWRMPDGRPLVDAYMLGNYSGNMPLPAGLPQDAPVVVVRSVREISNNARDGFAQSPDSDAPRVRVYDFNGSAHIGSRDVGSGTLQIAELAPTASSASSAGPSSAGPPGPPGGPPGLPGPPRGPRPAICKTGLPYDEPVEPVISAIYADMDAWVRTGKPMPRAPRVTVVDKATVKDPVTGIPEGGLRPPWIEVPSATYLVGDEVGCGANDVKAPYAAATLRDRYGTYANYAKLFQAAKRRLAGAGFLLPKDEDDVRPVAQPEDFK